jgi:hypothetical protein
MLQLARLAGRALVNTAHCENYSRSEFHEIPRLPTEARDRSEQYCSLSTQSGGPIGYSDAGLRMSNFGTSDAETLLQDCGRDILSARDVDESLSLPRLPRQIDTLFTDI